MLILILAFVIFIITLVFSVFRKHRNSHLQDKITHSVFLRNTLLEISGILLAMTLAGLLGRYLAQVATAQIDHDFMRLITGVFIGILVGVFVGLLVSHAWGRWIKP